MAQFLVLGEPGAAAVGVVDDRGLEVRAVGRLGLDQVADEREAQDHAGRHAAAHRAGDDGLTDLKSEKVRWSVESCR